MIRIRHYLSGNDVCLARIQHIDIKPFESIDLDKMTSGENFIVCCKYTLRHRRFTHCTLDYKMTAIENPSAAN